MNANEILKKVGELIISRASQRDLREERSMAKTVKAFNTATGHNLTEADGWIFMQHLKAARASQGRFNADDYLDKIAYAVLEAECVFKESKKQ